MTRKITFEVELHGDSRVTFKTFSDGNLTAVELLGIIELIKQTALSNNYKELSKIEEIKPGQP